MAVEFRAERGCGSCSLPVSDQGQGLKGAWPAVLAVVEGAATNAAPRWPILYLDPLFGSRSDLLLALAKAVQSSQIKQWPGPFEQHLYQAMGPPKTARAGRYGASVCHMWQLCWTLTSPHSKYDPNVYQPRAGLGSSLPGAGHGPLLTHRLADLLLQRICRPKYLPSITRSAASKAPE